MITGYRADRIIVDDPQTWVHASPEEIMADIKRGFAAMDMARGPDNSVEIPLARYQRMFTNRRPARGWRRHKRRSGK